VHVPPLITLVTPSFNQGRYLRATIESVLSQGYPSLRYVVMDGGSTDGSVEIIREYADRLTHWESGPDGGQTAAIRRGFEIGGGEILNWINSDDYLEPGALWRVAELAVKEPQAAILAFPVRDVVDTPDGVREVHVTTPGGLELDNLLLTRLPRPRRHQPGLFMRRSCFERAGGLNDRLNICMDFDLHLRMMACGGTVAYGDGIVANFRQHPASKTHSGRNLCVWISEYIDCATTVANTLGRRHSNVPHAPYVARAIMGALRSRSIAELREGLALFRKVGAWNTAWGCMKALSRRWYPR
jgi:glycosyltransferase involved in cell wall biosynthesis